MRPLLFAAVMLAAAPFLSAGAFAADRVSVVAAENFYGDVARQIGGDHVAVTSILSNPDEDPHLFETSPSTARAVADAGIVIYNGAGYDPWMEKLVSASSADSRTAIVAAALTGRKAGDNPHLWYDPATLPAVARALGGELVRRDPENTADYEANLAKFTLSMEKIGKEIANVRKAYGGTEVTATEPVFGYMAEALGFKMLNGKFQTAVMNDAEPTPKQVIAFEKSLKDGSAKILFYNSQVTDQATERLLGIAKENKVSVIGVTETMPAGQTIQSWFAGQIGAVEKALAARAQ
ncbi:MAG: zinc ABC transporter substrate-binding protein [Hyphomicrobiales bacterium]|nr:zinc ABC transporter substrate-binding protein [Hyphomicrobiales bacterium]